MAIANSDGSIILSTKIVFDGLDKAAQTIKNKFAKISREKNAFSFFTEESKRLQGQLKELEKEYAILLSKENELGNNETFTYKLADLEAKIAGTKWQLKETMEQLGALGKKSTKSFDDMSKGLKNLGKRIVGIIKSALIFSVLYKVMQAVVKLFQNILMSDEEFRQDWEELKAAFYTAAYPIVNLIVPAIKFIVQQVRDWAVSIGKVAAALQGMSYSELVDQAKSSKEAADNYADMEKSSKKAADNVKKQLASFDDIQILSSGNDSKDGANLAGFEGLKEYDTSGAKSMLEDIMNAIGGALMAVGLILLFHGQITWGIGFLVAGAAFWAITKFSVGQFSTDPIVNTLVKIMGIAGTALLALGIILCVFGVITPVSIGLIVAGAASLVGALALSNEAIVEAIRGPIGAIMAIVSGALLVLGIILICTGVGIPLGISLILAGAAGLATVVAVNWDAIVDWVKGAWDAVTAFWNKYIAPIFTAAFWLDLAKTCGNGLIAGFEAAINGIIWLFEGLINFVTSGLNLFINGLSTVTGAVGDLIGVDLRIPEIPKVNLGRVSIPRLAQGAVIPPNREFLAVLGDQKQGTNIEAPLQTIVDAFNIALAQNANAGVGNTEVVLEIDGREFGRAVVEQGNRENRRIGTRLVIA